MLRYRTNSPPARDDALHKPSFDCLSVYRMKIVFLLLLLGMRLSTMSWLRREDFEPKHLFLDNTIGPAIRFTYLKRRAGHNVGKESATNTPRRSKSTSTM